jgi:fatty-acid desaturase
MPAERFVRLQRMHFFMCDALPMLLAICLPLWVDRSLFMWQGIAIGIGMWFLVGGVGISVGFHRHFSHRAFSAHHFIRFMMGVCGCMAAQGSPIYWVALHCIACITRTATVRRTHTRPKRRPIKKPRPFADSCKATWGG